MLPQRFPRPGDTERPIASDSDAVGYQIRSNSSVDARIGTVLDATPLRESEFSESSYVPTPPLTPWFAELDPCPSGVRSNWNAPSGANSRFRERTRMFRSTFSKSALIGLSILMLTTVANAGRVTKIALAVANPTPACGVATIASVTVTANLSREDRAKLGRGDTLSAAIEIWEDDWFWGDDLLYGGTVTFALADMINVGGAQLVRKTVAVTLTCMNNCNLQGPNGVDDENPTHDIYAYAKKRGLATPNVRITCVKSEAQVAMAGYDGAPGDIAPFDAVVSTDVGIAAFSYELEFDPATFEVVSADFGAATTSAFAGTTADFGPHRPGSVLFIAENPSDVLVPGGIAFTVELKFLDGAAYGEYTLVNGDETQLMTAAGDTVEAPQLIHRIAVHPVDDDPPTIDATLISVTSDGSVFGAAGAVADEYLELGVQVHVRSLDGSVEGFGRGQVESDGSFALGPVFDSASAGPMLLTLTDGNQNVFRRVLQSEPFSAPAFDLQLLDSVTLVDLAACGQFCGTLPSGNPMAAVRMDGETTAIPAPGTSSAAEGIADDGTIVGSFYDGVFKPFVKRPNSGMEQLPTLGVENGGVWGIADRARFAVGWSSQGVLSSTYPVVWRLRGSRDADEVQALYSPWGQRQGMALAVNNAGTIVGWALDLAGVPHALVWEIDPDDGYSVTDLGPGVAFDVADYGAVIGRLSVAGVNRAFYSVEGQTALLPLPAGCASCDSTADTLDEFGNVFGTADSDLPLLWDVASAQPTVTNVNDLITNPLPGISIRNVTETRSHQTLVRVVQNFSAYLLTPIGSLDPDLDGDETPDVCDAPDTHGKHVIVAAEGAGLIDSVTALEESLPFDTVVIDTMSQLTGIPASLWVILGTYPDNAQLTPEEGEQLAELLEEDVPVYVDGADVWGYDPPTPFDDVDGVADGAEDGDDTHSEMVGADVLDGTGGGYRQDQLGNDFIDRLVPAGPGEDLLGDDTAAILHDSSLTFSTAIRYRTATGVGNVICMSSEFGGFDGDRAELAERMVAFLFDLEDEEPDFLRGDANDDGSVNIADAIFTASALFVAGSPGPMCPDAADVNDDGAIDVGDVVYTASMLFVVDSTPPPAPFPDCGQDPTTDDLECSGPGSGC